MCHKTKIEYLTHTANPYPGCVPISAGCLNCWAKRNANFRRRPPFGYIDGKFQPGHYNANWAEGLGGKPKVVGVNFNGDLFGEWMPFGQVKDVLLGCLGLNVNQYLFLTKRAKNMRDCLLDLKGAGYCPDNAWFGVSICNQTDWDKSCARLTLIKQMGFKTWLSFEPLIGPIDFGCEPLPADWVVVGGESGHGARFMMSSWIEKIAGKAIDENIPVYFKQWGDAYYLQNKLAIELEKFKQYPPQIGEIRGLLK